MMPDEGENHAAPQGTYTYSETREQFWGRVIQWAIPRLKEENRNTTITGICKLIEIKKQNVIKILNQL